MPAQLRAMARKLAGDHADHSGGLACVERGADAGRDLAQLAVRARGFEQFEPAPGGGAAGTSRSGATASAAPASAR